MTEKLNHNILILNGPNLNLLGHREPSIYGTRSFENYFEQLMSMFPNVSLHYFQSNHEGVLIDKLHETRKMQTIGIVFNPGGYTHTSIALADAVSAIGTPVIEVHLSNIFARETFRHHSYISPVARGVISGLGLNGYALAISQLLLDAKKSV